MSLVHYRAFNDTWNSEIKYTAFGEVRASYGLTPTDYRYTGQLEQAELGLYYYVARWYDPYLNHWVQPDSIIPEPYTTKDWNRYSYVGDNPIRYSDPSGHASDQGGGASQMGEGYWFLRKFGKYFTPKNTINIANTIFGGILKFTGALPEKMVVSTPIELGPVFKTIPKPDIVKSIGRIGNTYEGPLLIFGAGLNVVPNFVENCKSSSFALLTIGE